MKRIIYHIAKLIKLPSPREGLGVGLWGSLGVLILLSSCISTRDIPEGDQLFTGLKKISYDVDTLNDKSSAFNVQRSSQHLADTKEELEVALATAPNGALFGSSYYRVPFSWRLWVQNTFGGKDSKFARWMTKSFGKKPVLMSQVNPALRASVAQSVLRNNGYFRGYVTYEAVPQKNPKKSKLAYHVHLDSLFTLDSIAYVGFPDTPRRLIDSTAADALIHRGDPFSVSMLENERSRIGSLMRNNGYYYYKPGYVTYLADTVNTPNRSQLRLQLVDELPEEAMRQWYIGNIDIMFRRSVREQPTDSMHRRHLNIFFNGKKPPIRPRVMLKNMRLRPRELYSLEKYQETVAKINATGVFSSIDFQFTPRDADTLDLRMNCTFDKPYDFYFETNFNARTIGRYGPEVRVGFTKRNAFKGAEKLDINLHGSNEWQQGGGGKSTNFYQYGADASIEFPRIIAPFYNSDRIRRGKDGRPRPRRFISASTTLAKMSFDVIQRPDFYRMHIASGEWTYRWQSSAQSSHEFSPLTLKYQRINTSTLQFDSIMASNPYISTTMENQFIPKMRYTYLYKSPTSKRNPIRWETTIEEAGNATALYDVLIQGNGWKQEDKTLFKNPYAQFLRVETDFTKTWQLNSSSQLVGHLNTGVIYSYGNSSYPPFTEAFYVGGANSIRAFPVRYIGPGGFIQVGVRQFSYLMQNGDFKFVGNLEYRSQLFGNLNGALFLDMGNIWNLESEHLEYGEFGPDVDDETIDVLNYLEEVSRIKASRLIDQTAVATGVGLRYDLGFLVIRIDWGLALHVPYPTERSRYLFNWNRFSEAQTLHFAIGYPF